MAEKENPISLRSKRLITNSLIELMEETPFSKISIRDIVEKAGLTRQTFYHNYDSKEDVLLEKLDEFFEGFFKFCMENKVVSIEDVIWLYFRFWQTHDDFLKLLIKNNLVYLLEARYPQYFKLMRVIYLREVDLTEIECEYAFAFVCGAIINLLVTWVAGGELMSPKEMASFVMGFVNGEIYKVAAKQETESLLGESKYSRDYIEAISEKL